MPSSHDVLCFTCGCKLGIAPDPDGYVTGVHKGWCNVDHGTMCVCIGCGVHMPTIEGSSTNTAAVYLCALVGDLVADPDWRPPDEA